MICEACHGQQAFPPCPECGGCGISHCCDGLIEFPPVGRPTSADKQSSEPMSSGGQRVPERQRSPSAGRPGGRDGQHEGATSSDKGRGIEARWGS